MGHMDHTDFFLLGTSVGVLITLALWMIADSTIDPSTPVRQPERTHDHE